MINQETISGTIKNTCNVFNENIEFLRSGYLITGTIAVPDIPTSCRIL